ncbi:DUF4062 domain-containing protein [Microvirga sp. 2MCAF35]|uniref:DUF4062 domain-containing protein n=1 Tax=Microvirga sp. 2MCAF35 TaxID=3232987 RepID=UPI003F956CF8
MKVFISSVITGYEAVRAAAQDAIETLGHEVIRAEDFGASASSPQIACLSGVRDADLVFLLMGRRYGAVQASGISATHEEFREAKGTKEIIALVETVDDRESAQQAFLDEVQDWQGGVFTESFATSEDVRRLITQALHRRAVDEARGASDAHEVLNRCLSVLPSSERGWSNGHITLGLAVAGGPSQTLLRPIQIESRELDEKLFQFALHGPNAVFDRREGTEPAIAGDALVLKQSSRSVAVHADGSVSLRLPIESESQMMALIEEDVREAMVRGLGFLNDVLAAIDPTERLRRIGISSIILGADYTGWRTRAEDRRSPNSIDCVRQVLQRGAAGRAG